MKTYLEQLEQLEQLERLPENHFCFEPVTGTPEVPISSRSLDSRLSVITLAANDAQLVGGTLAEGWKVKRSENCGRLKVG